MVLAKVGFEMDLLMPSLLSFLLYSTQDLIIPEKIHLLLT